MLGTTRGIATLLGAATAVFLIWLAAQMGDDTAGEYWATYGLIAAAGLTMALSQVLGGWTKWGWPRLSLGVFVIGFLPVAIVGLWVLFSRQPGDPLLSTGSWSDDIGVGGVVSDLGELLAALAFLVGLTFGFTFDTTGPRVRAYPGQPIEREDTVDERASDEPLTAERDEVAQERGDMARDGDETAVDDPPARVIRQ
jgi:hypothetical protein